MFSNFHHDSPQNDAEFFARQATDWKRKNQMPPQSTGDTVDGTNPAPVGRWFLLFFTWF